MNAVRCESFIDRVSVAQTTPSCSACKGHAVLTGENLQRSRSGGNESKRWVQFHRRRFDSGIHTYAASFADGCRCKYPPLTVVPSTFSI